MTNEFAPGEDNSEIDKSAYSYLINETRQVSLHYTKGEIRCFHNSEKLWKPYCPKFCCVSAGRFRLETCKMKIEALFRVSAALPLT